MSVYRDTRPPDWQDDDEDATQESAEPGPIALIEDSNQNASASYRADEAYAEDPRGVSR